MMNGIIEHSGIDYASVSFIIAVGQILYGATQPVFGMLALKKSNTCVLFLGICMMAAGLIATPLCTSTWSLLLFFGIILPSGTGALCFGIVMGAIAPIIGEKRAAMASGIVQASAGIGDALMSPELQYLTAWRGVSFSLPLFSVPILLTIPAVAWLGRSRKESGLQAAQQERTAGASETEKLSAILRASFHDPAYWCLLIGFSTCGFHMSIIETHLFSQYVANGIPGNIASLALTVYGTATMLGAIITGFLGLTGDSTVPPTTGIISAKVGVAKMAIVYGSIFIGHQIGAFSSAWLGGILVNTGLGYTALWIADLCLCAIAAAASFRIRD